MLRQNHVFPKTSDSRIGSIVAVVYVFVSDIVSLFAPVTVFTSSFALISLQL